MRGADDIFIVPLEKLKTGLYFCRIYLKTAFGEFYGISHRGGIRFTRDSSVHDTVQISVSDFSELTKNEYLGGVIYHVFVDRFDKGTKRVPIKIDARIIEDWSEKIAEYPAYPGAHLENNTFYGGTIYGVVENLDYFVSLGVTLIYLSPIFDAYSNHKYDTADYMTVDCMFGGEDALVCLINEAKKRGIGILLDGVFNHTGSDSIYFNKKGRYPSLGAYNSKDSPYYGWYDFSNHPESYECWWGIPILPRIHPDRESCRDFFLGKGGVIEKYANMGIAGFRLDVADELSDHFIAGIKTKLLESNEKALLYGEVWEDASNKIAYDVRKQYYLGKELDGVMNYPLRKALISYFKDKNTEELNYYFTEVHPNMPKRIADAQMNLLGTHDTVRILTALAGDDPNGYTNDILAKKRMSAAQYEYGKQLLKMLYTVIATLPGMPMIYYGDEVGMEGYCDPFNRMPFPHGNEDKDLLSHYRVIGQMRKKHSVYKNGEFSLLLLAPSHLFFLRKTKNNVYMTVANLAEQPLKFSLGVQGVDLLNKIKGTEFCIEQRTATVIKTSKNFLMEIKTKE
jgi:glycosidase